MKPGGSKLINLICITFSETYQGNKSKDSGMNILETMLENTQFKVEVPTMDASSSEGTIIEASDYHLTYDKVKRNIAPSQRNIHA